VIPEAVSQVAFVIAGSDVTVAFASEAGQLQLNAFEPVICYSLSSGLWRLRTAIESLTENCVRGITANTEHLAAEVANSIGLVTALNPYVGYQVATELAQEALTTVRGLAEIVLARGLMPKDELERILRPETLAHLGPKPADRSGGV